MGNGHAMAQPVTIATVRDMLGKMKDQLQMALPQHVGVERFMRVALTSCQKNPKLLECSPVTLVGAMVQCAQLGLEPDDGTGKAYLVPFFNSKKGRLEVQFIAGYRGLVDLCRRSGAVQGIESRVVHEKDAFRFGFGLTPILEHTPSTDAAPGEAIYFYAIARFKEGGAQFDVMTVADVEKIRQRSKAKDAGPWQTDYEEMGKKTVIRRLMKLLPASPELQRAVTLDERHEIGLPQDLGTLVDASEQGTDNVEAQPLPEPPRRKNQSEQTESSPAVEAWKAFVTKSITTCSGCQVKIDPDQQAYFSPKTGEAQCVACHEAASALA